MELQFLLQKVNAEATKETLKDVEEQLIVYINELIQNDFGKLVSLLYRVDVDEQNLKALLQKEKGKDAALLIATLIIKRELEKATARKHAKQNPTIDDEEKW